MQECSEASMQFSEQNARSLLQSQSLIRQNLCGSTASQADGRKKLCQEKLILDLSKEINYIV